MSASHSSALSRDESFEAVLSRRLLLFFGAECSVAWGSVVLMLLVTEGAMLVVM